MVNEEYAKLLLRPEWKERRLQILKRDDYTCRRCGAQGKVMNVHHLRYDKSIMPWEYGDEDLITLCEDCHKEIHKKKKHIYDGKEFVMFFGSFCDIVREMDYSATKVYLYLLLQADVKNNCVINIGVGYRKTLPDKIGICGSAIYKGIVKLKKLNLIKMVGGNVYLNPNVVWCGKLSNRQSAIEKYNSL